MDILKFFGLKREKSAQEKVQEQQRNYEILVHNGKLAMNVGELDHAVQCFKKAIELKDEMATKKLLVECYVRLGDSESGFQLLESIALAEPENADLFILQAQFAYKLKRYQVMADLCQKAFLIDDNNPETYYLFAQANHAMHDEITAIAMLTKTIMLQEDLYEAHLMRAKILLEMGQDVDAEQDVDYLLEKVGDHEDFYYLKGVLYARKREVYNAIEAFDKAISINPYYQEAYVAKVKVYMTNNEEDKAFKLIARTLDNNPGFAQLYKLRGELKHRAGDDKGALEDITQAMQLDEELAHQIDGKFTTMQQQMEQRYKAQNPYGF